MKSVYDLQQRCEGFVHVGARGHRLSRLDVLQGAKDAKPDTPKDWAEGEAGLAEELSGLCMSDGSVGEDAAHHDAELLLALFGDPERDYCARRDL